MAHEINEGIDKIFHLIGHGLSNGFNLASEYLGTTSAVLLTASATFFCLSIFNTMAVKTYRYYKGEITNKFPPRRKDIEGHQREIKQMSEQMARTDTFATGVPFLASVWTGGFAILAVAIHYAPDVIEYLAPRLGSAASGLCPEIVCHP